MSDTTMICKIESRKIIRVTGEDAPIFLQNILTNDIRRLGENTALQYNLLLSPQGKVLHEVFVVFRGKNDYWLDVAAERADDLLRRLAMFRLRAKVTIDAETTNECGIFVSFPETGDATQGWIIDPRRSDLGGRMYATAERFPTTTTDENAYDDFCISRNIVTAKALRPESDFVHDVGFDKLNAIGWDKGCFIGQEVAARVEYKGLAKKALFHLDAVAPIDATQPITTADGTAVGDIRHVSTSGKQALAVIKTIAIQDDISLLNANQPLQVRRGTL